LNYLSKIQKIQSNVQNSSAQNSKPPSNNLPSLPTSSSSSDATINSDTTTPVDCTFGGIASSPLSPPPFLQSRNAATDAAIPRNLSLADSTAPSSVSSIASGSSKAGPKGKLSLSQRRGLKLNLDSITSGSSSESTPTSANEGNEGNTEIVRDIGGVSGPTPSVNRLQNSSVPNLQNKMSKMTLNLNNNNSNRLNMNTMRESSLPARRNQMKLNLNGLPNSNPMIKQLPSGARGGLPQMHLPHAASAPPSQASNSFAPFAKFIDVKSGSLNFSGKASLHSKGVDFENGSSFRISMDDLDVLEELGHGNYGVVSKVLHKPTGIIMAMKEVRLELDDDKFRQILMELEVLHSCNSDCIIEFYGAFFVEGAVYMCIEFMKGGSLDKIYGDGIPEIALAYITKRVVHGLKQLKDEHNIIHRDVKPTNMLVNENGKVKLCDFGVSGNLVASLARTNIGCQSYMAPERIKHANPDVSTYTVQSDIWSLGLSILEISKGSYPYPPETYNNVFSQLSAIVDGEPPQLPVDKFSLEAQDFVRQCLNKNPSKRPTYSQLLMHPWLQNCSEMEGEEVLKRIVQEEIRKRETGKNDDKSSKSVPALHSGLQR
jgi:mitogen-activated protein kinase kinase